MAVKEYFHEITDHAFQSLSDAGATWEDVKEKYKAPDWCGYGASALDGGMGCWSLVGRRVTGREFCKNCEAQKESEND